MSEETQTALAPVFELPEDAPRVRITAGVGSATQKTWTIRRPITLIGSRRPAHIILHDRDISEAHCVIVNTGTEVLLKDLFTRAGTRRNNIPINLVALKDGDVITIGTTIIQVAIKAADGRTPPASPRPGAGDPTRFPHPVSLELIDEGQQWKLRESVVLVGRHEAAPIWLDHEDISNRHAVIFRYRNEPIIFDLGAPGGVWVNGRPVSLSKLFHGDRVTLGPFRFRLRSASGAVGEKGPPRLPAVTETIGAAGPASASSASGPTTGPAAPPHTSPGSNGDRLAQAPTDAHAPSLMAINTELNTLRENIATAWERLNAWKAAPLDEVATAKPGNEELAAREAELDALDASLRGQLHDVSQLHERLLGRKRELEEQFQQLEQQRDQLALLQDDLAARETDLARQTEELARRERIVAHRWSRMQSASCPHCGNRIAFGESRADAAGPG